MCICAHDLKLGFRKQSDMLCCVLIAALFFRWLTLSHTVTKLQPWDDSVVLKWLPWAGLAECSLPFCATLCNKSAGYSRVQPLSHQLTVWITGFVSRFIAMTLDLCTAHAHRASLEQNSTPSLLPSSPWPFSEMPPVTNQIVTCLNIPARAMYPSELESVFFFFFSPCWLTLIKPGQVVL